MAVSSKQAVGRPRGELFFSGQTFPKGPQIDIKQGASPTTFEIFSDGQRVSTGTREFAEQIIANKAPLPGFKPKPVSPVSALSSDDGVKKLEDIKKDIEPSDESATTGTTGTTRTGEVKQPSAEEALSKKIFDEEKSELYLQ